MLGFLQNSQQIYGPFLVVLSLWTLSNWAKEFQKWLPNMNVIVYVGTRGSRECPQQLQSYECVYYVMKWMYDITVRYALSEDDIVKCVSGSQMTIEQMNEVREFWSLYCGKNV